MTDSALGAWDRPQREDIGQRPERPRSAWMTPAAAYPDTRPAAGPAAVPPDGWPARRDLDQPHPGGRWAAPLPTGPSFGDPHLSGGDGHGERHGRPDRPERRPSGTAPVGPAPASPGPAGAGPGLSGAGPSPARPDRSGPPRAERHEGSEGPSGGPRSSGPPSNGRFGKVLFVAVLGGVTLGLLLVTQDYWRRGLLTVGGVLLVASALRLCLPTRKVGMLAVRGRLFDTVTLVVLGLAVIVLTLEVPHVGG
ncbi:DUF3017 domain-containing protein [Frankia sp. CcI49]|uniref:DUF3017 domain-containing protein n=1 Tax=Frankia sp. CcI49 TaxID=1745382 RepID=UPI001F51D8F4|nr:DUF3017 domain-containing protein [Frankia sp. CcI49]